MSNGRQHRECGSTGPLLPPGTGYVALGSAILPMTTRTTSRMVTFSHPFFLNGIGEVRPAGTYTVETDEELVQEISFPVFCRTVMFMVLPGSPQRHRSCTDRHDKSSGVGGRPGARRHEEGPLIAQAPIVHTNSLRPRMIARNRLAQSGR